MSTPNMTIDHNYWGGAMSRAIAHWAPNKPLNNIRIHHNIFFGSYSDTLIWLKSGTPGLLFANNVYAKTARGGGGRIVYLDGGSSDGMIFANNLVHVDPRSAREDLMVVNAGASASGLIVRNNWFQRINPDKPAGTWTDNYLGSERPPVLATGELWEDYFVPQSGSALVDGGIDVGLDYFGTAPDIGWREVMAWRSYPVGENGWVDTGSWLSWVNVSNDPWIWSASLQGWLYSQDQSDWFYIPRN